MREVFLIRRNITVYEHERPVFRQNVVNGELSSPNSAYSYRGVQRAMADPEIEGIIEQLI